MMYLEDIFTWHFPLYTAGGNVHVYRINTSSELLSVVT